MPALCPRLVGRKQRNLIHQNLMNEKETELLDKSPHLPGRPMKIGKNLMRGPNQIEIAEIRESSSVRYHLGYCDCGRHITAGYEKMDALLTAMEENKFPRQKKRVPLRQRLGKFLLQ